MLEVSRSFKNILIILLLFTVFDVIIRYTRYHSSLNSKGAEIFGPNGFFTVTNPETDDPTCLYSSMYTFDEATRLMSSLRPEPEFLQSKLDDTRFKKFEKEFFTAKDMPKYIHKIAHRRETENTKFVESYAKFTNFELKIHNQNDIEDIILMEYNHFWEIYELMSPTQKHNFMKYIIIYKYGGFYIESADLNPSGNGNPLIPLFDMAFDFNEDNFLAFVSSVSHPTGSNWLVRQGATTYPIRISEKIFFATVKSPIVYRIILKTLVRTHRVSIMSSDQKQEINPYYIAHYTSGADVMTEIVLSGPNNDIAHGVKLVGLHMSAKYRGLGISSVQL